MMNIIVYDTELNILGVIDTYKTVIWNYKFYDFGTFEITAPIIQNNIKLLNIGRLIRKDNDYEMAYIQSIEITDNEEGMYIKAVGSLYTAIFLQRVCIQNGNNLKELIVNNLREINNINISDDLKILKLSSNYKGETVGDVMLSFSKLKTYGYKAILKDKKIELIIYDGKDSSINQTENPYCIFSNDFENIINATYINNMYGVYNSIYVQGTAGDDVAFGEKFIPEYEAAIVDMDKQIEDKRKEVFEAQQTLSYDDPQIRTLQNELKELRDQNAILHEILASLYSMPTELPLYQLTIGSGINRYEKYIEIECATYDIRGVLYVDYGETTKLMIEAAKNELVLPQESFVGEVNFKLKYKMDYDIGDIVTIRNDSWNVSINKKITEITETYDNQNDSVEPVFGDPQRTLIDIIKDMKKKVK